MFYFLCLFNGILSAVIIVLNGMLSDNYGTYTGTVIVHLVGLICISLFMIFKKEKFFNKEKIPLWLYTGGIIGAGTTVFNTVAFSSISVSSILALSLLTQSILSVIIDSYGLFGVKKQKQTPYKLIGYLFLFIGICVLLFPIEIGNVIGIIAAIITGITTVASRTINGAFSEKTTPAQSTFYNFFTGLLLSIILTLCLGLNEPAFTDLHISNNLLIYSGGILCVLSVFILNVIVRKISAFYLTLLVFIGQINAGLILDIILEQSFSKQNLIGSVFVLIGLIFNLIIDEKLKKRDYEITKN